MKRKLLIKGLSFKYDIHDPKSYIKEHGDGHYAHVDREDHIIAFRLDRFTKEIVIHELTHCYVIATFVRDMDELKVDDFEEIFCEINAYHLEDIKRQADLIYKKLKPKHVNWKKRNKK